MTSSLRLTLCWVSPAASLAALRRFPTPCNSLNGCLQVFEALVGGSDFFECSVELYVSDELSNVDVVELAEREGHFEADCGVACFPISQGSFVNS